MQRSTTLSVMTYLLIIDKRKRNISFTITAARSKTDCLFPVCNTWLKWLYDLRLPDITTPSGETFTKQDKTKRALTISFSSEFLWPFTRKIRPFNTLSKRGKIMKSQLVPASHRKWVLKPPEISRIDMYSQSWEGYIEICSDIVTNYLLKNIASKVIHVPQYYSNATFLLYVTFG